MEEPNLYSFWDSHILSKEANQEGIETDQVPEEALQKALKYINQAVQLEKNKHARQRLDTILHSTSFKNLVKITVAINLLVAYFQYPPVSSMKTHPYVFFIIQLFCLCIFGIQLTLRFLVQKWKVFSRNLWNWTSFVCIILILIDNIISLAWTSHIPPSIALKIFFLADLNSYSRSLLRLIVFTSTKMIKMLIMLLTYILFFSLLGMILFHKGEENAYFSNFLESFLSLVVCISTANFPDVMVPSYLDNPVISVIFFVSFLSLGLFFGMNFILATAYKRFHERAAHEVLKKYMYQRATLLKAFYILDEAETRKIRTMFISKPTFIEIIRRGNPDKIPKELEELDDHIPTLKFFKLCDTFIIREWMNWKTERQYPSYEQIGEMVKAYKESLSASLKIKPHWWRFLEVGATTRMRAKGIFNNWYHTFRSKLIGRLTQAFLVLILIGNAVVIVIMIESGRFDSPISVSILDWIFLFIFLIEVGFRVFTRGITARKWNLFDFLVVSIAFIGKLIVVILFYIWHPNRDHEYTLVRVQCFFSLLKLMRIVSILKHARAFVKRIIQLLAIIGHFAVVVFAMMYVFAVVGMLSFQGVFVKGNEKLIGTAYDSSNYYTLINFETFQGSLMFLFHLIVVNNWYISMRAAMIATSNWACIFFLLFYYSMIVVVINVAIAFVIEAVKFINENNEDVEVQGKKVHEMEEQIMANRLEEISRNSMQSTNMKEKFQHSFASTIKESKFKGLKEAFIKIFVNKKENSTSSA